MSMLQGAAADAAGCENAVAWLWKLWHGAGSCGRSVRARASEVSSTFNAIFGTARALGYSG